MLAQLAAYFNAKKTGLKNAVEMRMDGTQTILVY
jgi:hypothetical protein